MNALREIRPSDAASFQLVFPHGLTNYRTFRKDLLNAGIPVRSESGEKVDFHALRGTFRMFLHRHQVPLEAVVLLMRHSDSRLAMREYLDESQLALGRSVTILPLLNAQVQQSGVHPHHLTHKPKLCAL
jgi:integrase